MELISGYICKLAATYTSTIPGLKFVAKNKYNSIRENLDMSFNA